MVNIVKFVFFFLLQSATIFALFEGDQCVLTDPDVPSKEGKCTDVHQCDYAKELLQKRKSPQTCGFVGRKPLVCCPSKPVLEVKDDEEGSKCIPVSGGKLPLENGTCVYNEKCDYDKVFELTGKLPGYCEKSNGDRIYTLNCCPTSGLKKELKFSTIAESKCFNYYDRSRGSSFVSNGKKASSKEFPHMAAIGYKQNNNIQWFCGGSLISENFVLTAAHCTYFEGMVPNLIRLGDLDLEGTTEDASPVDFTISETFVHPEYKSLHYHDIALFKLSKSQEFNLYIQPACLHVEKQLPATLQATGWGKTSYAGPVSSHLMKVMLKVTNHRTCNESYTKTKNRRLLQGIIDEMQICAGGDTTKDTCPGDSGGPLHYKKNEDSRYRDHFVVAGVTSFGRGCGFGTTPGVYTRVSNYISWIENIVWP